MIDPHDPDWYLAGDHETVLAQMRSACPVTEYKAGHHAVSTYDHVRAVARDYSAFISGKGVLVNDPMRTLDPFPVPPTLLQMDPPQHTQYRKIVSRVFTPRAVRRLEPRLREVAREVLDAVPLGVAVDAVSQVAVPLPVTAIAELLGLPESVHEDFRRRSDMTLEAGENDSDAIEAALELFAILGEHVAQTRERGGDHVVARLVAAEVDGHLLTDAEVQVFCVTLLVGGNETTRHLISGGIKCLAEHPDQYAMLRADRSLLPGAIEEMLRFTTPVKAFARTAAADVALGGCPVKQGDYVVMLYASANRDETVFGPSAGEFDITRVGDPAHVSFGFGEHLCLGASLARLEARVLFEQMLDRVASIRIIGEPVPVRSTIMQGWASLPVVFEPAQ